MYPSSLDFCPFSNSAHARTVCVVRRHKCGELLARKKLRFYFQHRLCFICIRTNTDPKIYVDHRSYLTDFWIHTANLQQKRVIKKICHLFT